MRVQHVDVSIVGWIFRSFIRNINGFALMASLWTSAWSLADNTGSMVVATESFLTVAFLFGQEFRAFADVLIATVQTRIGMLKVLMMPVAFGM